MTCASGGKGGDDFFSEMRRKAREGESLLSQAEGLVAGACELRSVRAARVIC